MVDLATILCPVDFSDGSRHAVRWAAALASRHGARLIVLNAVDPLLAEAARVKLGIDLTQTGTDPALRDFVAASNPADER
ncbi:MAG: universal stress protein, partial [Chloroflexota bacterium]|nr:universal stress protein [Chloroflexota bacterium]